MRNPPVRLLAQNQYFQLVVYAALTAFFIVTGNKMAGNGSLTVTWNPGPPQVTSREFENSFRFVKNTFFFKNSELAQEPPYKCIASEFAP